MSNQPDRMPTVIHVLIILHSLLGFGALISGAMLVLAPDGSWMQMPVSMLEYSPFDNFLIPGLILASVLGLFPLAVAFSLWRRPVWRWPDTINPWTHLHWSWAGSLAAGIAVVIWILVQVGMLRTVAFLHVLYFFWGCALIALTFLADVRRFLKK